MAEITTTQAFSDGDTVTATKLNNITANAAIQTEAITNRSAETTVDQANDLLLMYDASATALKKVTLSNVIKAGTASNFPVTGNATIGGTLGVTGVISAASTLELGHASDTTLSRGAAGRLQVEGVDVPTISSTDTLTNKTLTSPAINAGTISGGTINNAVIGGTTAAAGSFTTLSATSPITTQAGTAASPAIVPTGDTNTGIFFPAADTIAFSEGGTEAMRIDSSGKVGIGTTSPSNRLHIVNSGAGALALQTTEASSDQTQIRFIGTTGDKWAIGNNAATGGAGANFDIYDIASGANRLRIDSSGNVGIGTSSPARGLSIYKAGATSRLIIQSDVSGQAINNGLDIYLDQSNNAGVWNYQNASLIFATNNTERLRITSGGNVLVGTTLDADHKIHVNHSHPTSGGGGISINQAVTGTSRAIQFVYQTNTQVGSITTTASATAYNTSSDYRLKTNLEPISDGIDRLKQLPVYRFNWIADEIGNKVDGFVAHEAQAIVPECVTGEKDAVDADGKPVYQGIDQSKIVPLLTAALKEAIAKIETLESKVAALEAA